jgi:hypothetical protein
MRRSLLLRISRRARRFDRGIEGLWNDLVQLGAGRRGAFELHLFLESTAFCEPSMTALSSATTASRLSKLAFNPASVVSPLAWLSFSIAFPAASRVSLAKSGSSSTV